MFEEKPLIRLFAIFFFFLQFFLFLLIVPNFFFVSSIDFSHCLFLSKVGYLQVCITFSKWQKRKYTEIVPFSLPLLFPCCSSIQVPTYCSLHLQFSEQCCRPYCVLYLGTVVRQSRFRPEHAVCIYETYGSNFARFISLVILDRISRHFTYILSNALS